MDLYDDFCALSQLYFLDGDLKEKLKQQVESYFKEPNPLMKAPFLSRLINWTLFEKNEPMMVFLKELARTHRRETELQEIFNFTARFIWESPSLDEVLSALCRNRFTPTLRNKEGNTFLHQIADDSEMLDRALNLLTETEYRTTVQTINREGYSALHYAAHYPESLQVMLKPIYLPEAQGLQVIKMHDDSGRPLIHCAANSPRALEKILNLYLPPERVPAIFLPDSEGNTVLHYARNNVQSYEVLFRYLGKEDKLKLAQLVNRNGETPFHHMVNHRNIKLLLASYPPQEHLSLLGLSNEAGETVMQTLAQNYKALSTVLAVLPEEERIKALELLTHWDELITLNILKLIPLLPQEDCLKALMIRDKSGCMFLHQAAMESQPLILDYLSKQDSYQALSIPDKTGRSILHQVVNRPDLFAKYFNSLTDTDQLRVLKQTDSSGKMLIEYAKNTKSFAAVNSLLARHHLTYREFLERAKPKGPAGSPFSFFGILSTFGEMYKTQKEFRGGQRPTR